ncbi:Protein of unknown function [Pyronema omphalodes CBS 100304]|uniref:Uncharacterized protein n=1 Tax=Pyronema omphalodes (strain CBS 100304) TaxID=1076935 RepID=U4KVG2_PYROM|nr:Protein of unknown function [Pyronema omphalodes CBS 100304]
MSTFVTRASSAAPSSGDNIVQLPALGNNNPNDPRQFSNAAYMAAANSGVPVTSTLTTATGDMLQYYLNEPQHEGGCVIIPRA